MLFILTSLPGLFSLFVILAMFIDTHTHLYLPEFKDDLADCFKRAAGQNIAAFYLPAIDSNHTESMFELEKAFPNCFAMIGLHPCSVKEDYQQELDHVASWLEKRKFAAIGEIGLDFYWDKTFIDQQLGSFKIQMEWALDYQLPIVIHSRNAMDECIEAVKPFASRGLRGIFHCFGGTKEQAEEIAGMNFMLGIGGVLTYKNSGLDKVLGEIPLDHIVLETDSPYLSPHPHRGKRNESSYLSLVAEKLALVKNISVDEVARITTENSIRIFGDPFKVS